MLSLANASRTIRNTFFAFSQASPRSPVRPLLRLENKLAGWLMRSQLSRWRVVAARERPEEGERAPARRGRLASCKLPQTKAYGAIEADSFRVAKLAALPC